MRGSGLMANNVEETQERDSQFIPTLDDEALKFIEKMGLYFDRYGVPRLAGRIIGLSMISDRPLNTDDMMAILGASRTAVSTNLKMGLASGYVEPTLRREPGDRRDYYQFSSDGFQNGMKMALVRLKEIVDLTKDALNHINPENKEGRKHLLEMIAFYDFLEEWTESLDREWAKRRAELKLD
jgi:DNA-binding transcriptional regulator GbsR (MarR family)